MGIRDHRHYHLLTIVSLLIIVSVGFLAYINAPAGRLSASQLGQGLTRRAVVFNAHGGGVAKLSFQPASPSNNLRSAQAAGTKVGLILELSQQ